MSIKAVAGRVQKQWVPKGKVLRKVPGMPPREKPVCLRLVSRLAPLAARTGTRVILK